MDYQDFTIGIRSAGENLFEATVIDAPFRENPRIFFPPPIDKPALQELVKASDQMAGAVSSPQLPLLANGEQLYSALVQSELADLFIRCRAVVAPGARSGLRIRLKFLVSDTEAEYLAALPWEWLWDSLNARFLATDLKSPIVRDYATRHSHVSLKVGSPLRILIVDAAPYTRKKLNLRKEIDQMREALEPLRKEEQVQLFQPEEPTLEAVRHALRDDKIHILHFMGHGGYHQGSKLGALFFERPDGSEDQVDGEELANFLTSLPELRLAVLNACMTARHAGHAGDFLHFGVASALLERAGIPAVVANQYAISDETATSFSRIFYRRLAEGDGVDEAITEVRLQLERHTQEWATPVLFLNSRCGRLVDPESAKAGARSSRMLPAFDLREEPVRLGIRSFDGWGRDMDDRNDEVLDLVKHFDDRFIRQREWWQEIIFPELRSFLMNHHDPRRPLLLDFAAHSSIAFAAGWILEAKSGIDVRVRQRTKDHREREWHPDDGSAEDDRALLWLDRPDIEATPGGTDIALALAVSQPDVAEHVEAFIRSAGLSVGRIIDATIAPQPGPDSVRGGAHAQRLAQSLFPRLRRRYPHERSGCLHLFCAGPNALLFYMGQLARSFDSLTLYEFAFGAPGNFGRYQASIELPPPAERSAIPEGW